MAHFFIVGTDTEVGKTYAACTLIHALRAAFPARRIAAMKPIAAGTDAFGRNDDVERLQAAANVRLPTALMTPYLFAPALAPHVAAQAAGVRIEIKQVLQNFALIAAQAEHVVVEGVGGFRVPLDEQLDTADLAQALNLPIILVVGLRLGCINHALLTAEAIERRGLTLAGWVGNAIDPGMVKPEASLAALRNRLAAPLLAYLPHDPQQRAASAAMHWNAGNKGFILP